MSRSFTLPDVGEGIHEAEIQEILVAEGDEVEEEQAILTVETDKAAVDIPSPFTGVVEEILVQSGDIVEVGATLMTFGGDGDSAETAEKEAPADQDKKETEAKEEAESKTAEAEKKPDTEERETGPPAGAPAGEDSQRPVPASPATRQLARELEVDLRQVPPSGEAGRVTSEDVRAFSEGGDFDKGEVEAKEKAPEEEKEPEEEKPRETVPAGKTSPLRPSAIELPPLPDFNRWGETERTPLRSIRRATAKKMVQAWSQIPHAQHHDRADITALEQLRSKEKDEIEEGSLSLSVFVMKAVAAALAEFPRFNASLDVDEQEIILKHYCHLGMAVDTERGLLVPVIRNVDQKSIATLAEELPDLVKRTQAGDLAPDDMQGGTFTITNVGILGGTHFDPIINYPQVAILGMAQAEWQPVVRDNNGEKVIEPRFMLPLVVAFDHRVLDGADAGRFLSMIIDLLEDPDKLTLMA